jgi:predicted nucleic acid-binding protein
MIAAVAASHEAAVVKRDVQGFDGCGITLVNR